jgi:hypothetical protein
MAAPLYRHTGTMGHMRPGTAHESHTVTQHDHSWHPDTYREGNGQGRCSGRYWCEDCKAWFELGKCKLVARSS